MALPLIISGLSAIAPIVGKMLGGDKGEEAAEYVADIARNVTGIGDVDKAVSAIHTDPKFRAEFLTQLNQHEEVMVGLYLSDRKDAREKHKHSIMPSVIVVSLTLMVAAMGAAMFYSAIPEENQTLANILFGAVLAKWADSIAYWVGSSRGSAEKQKMIN